MPLDGSVSHPKRLLDAEVIAVRTEALQDLSEALKSVGKCGRWMPRAKEPCPLAKDHVSGCRTLKWWVNKLSYKFSEKGKATQRKYDASEKGKARFRKYRSSEKGMITIFKKEAKKTLQIVEKRIAEL